jgi:excisionase family DNA binding protein
MKLLSEKETAEMLGISCRGVQRLRASGKLRAVVVGRDSIRYNAEAVAEYAKGQTLLDPLDTISICNGETGRAVSPAAAKQLAVSAGCAPRPSGAITRDDASKLRAYLKTDTGRAEAYRLADDGTVISQNHSRKA